MPPGNPIGRRDPASRLIWPTRPRAPGGQRPERRNRPPLVRRRPPSHRPQTPKDEFDLGIGYMQRKDYALAEQTMRDLAQKHPSEPAGRRTRNTGSAKAISSVSNIEMAGKPS